MSVKNFQMYKWGLGKAEEPEIKLPTFIGSLRKQGEFQKNIYFCFIYYTKALDSVSQQTGKFLKRWEYQATLTVSQETCIQVKKQQLEHYMEQLTGSKLGKEYDKAVYCHPVYLTYMGCTSCEMPGWMNHKWESRLWEKYQPPQICRWYQSNGRMQRRIKKPLDNGERG